MLYSSLENPSHEEWVSESNRLLDELKRHLDFYTSQIALYQEKKDDFMIKFYCLKLLAANKTLKMSKIEMS